MVLVVAGGGVAGLSAALVLARAGHHVTLIERDPLYHGDDWRAALEAPRAGVPHFHHPHSFIPRGRKLLREALPDVFDALLAAGARDYEVWRKAPAMTSGEPAAEDPDVAYLCARRAMFDWALSKAILTEPYITVRADTVVAGLLVEEGAVPRVRGVVTSSGEQLRGDLVVDAMGRRTQLPGWLSKFGAQPPEVDASECNLLYYSRFFQIRPGNSFPEGPWLTFPRGDLGYASFGCFIKDNLTFSITLNIPTWDRELRVIRREDAWMAASRLIPLLKTLLDPDFAYPITPVLPLGSLQNTLRNYAPGGRPVAVGVIPVADAYCHTDPAFSLGLSMSMIHAVELARSIEAHLGEPQNITCEYFAATFAETAERFAMIRDFDNERSRVWHGEEVDISKRTGSYPLFATTTASAVARRDAEVFRKVTRRFGFLDRTSVFDDDIELQERIEKLVVGIMAEGSGPPGGPDRNTLLSETAVALELAKRS